MKMSKMSFKWQMWKRRLLMWVGVRERKAIKKFFIFYLGFYMNFADESVEKL